MRNNENHHTGTRVTRATLASRQDAVAQAQALVSAFCADNHITGRDRMILCLVMEELVTNTLRHGAAPADAPIEVALARRQDRVEVAYADHGVAFDPLREAPAGEPITACLEGGLGWRLIRHYCPAIDYRHEAGQNRLRLVRDLENP
ncbi:MAG: ATP-binding protein [Pseudomonadota bacterium]|nr:ATP-binding protein [Pseudomonadota bacterium]